VIKAARFPKLVVLDLDFTLWDCGGRWVDCVSPPFVSGEDGCVRDQSGAVMRLYGDVLEILDFFRQHAVPLAVASRTSAPSDARTLMELLGIAGRFDHEEIYPGSKVGHFCALQERCGGLRFEEMLFFDDEERNIDEVGALGVDVHHVTAGLNWPAVTRALERHGTAAQGN
jgi:magnesium-dependent phosphatase 1